MVGGRRYMGNLCAFSIFCESKTALKKIVLIKKQSIYGMNMGLELRALTLKPYHGESRLQVQKLDFNFTQTHNPF